MTNAEKFEEVFGIKIDKDYPNDICGCVDPGICVDHNCDNECPAFHFWSKKYRNPNRSKNKNDKTE